MNSQATFAVPVLFLPATQKQILHLVARPSRGHFATQQECRKRCLQTGNSEAGIIKIICSLPLCFKNWTPWQVAKIKHQRGPPQARPRINIHVRAHHLLTLTAGKKSWRHLLGGQGSGWPGRAAQHSTGWECECALGVRARLGSGAAGASCERGPGAAWAGHSCLHHTPTHCWLTITGLAIVPPCPALLGHEGKLSLPQIKSVLPMTVIAEPSPCLYLSSAFFSSYFLCQSS